MYDIVKMFSYKEGQMSHIYECMFFFKNPVPMRASAATMEQSLAEGVLIDYWKDDDRYLCIRATAVKDICDRVSSLQHTSN